MKILAIETSCDDTGVAILEIKNNKFKVLSNVVSSQEIHQNYGGVFPMMAKREHQKNLVPVLIKALTEGQLVKPKTKNQISKPQIKNLKTILEKESVLYEKLIEFLEKYEKPDIDFIAVTNGPGLEPCLWVGVNFAKALSYFLDIPLVPINHIEAHILVNFLDYKSIQFPAISLVVSGGHTQLILMKRIGSYKIIGETRDDAAGECFDKAAKILGLGYPGGPIISQIASKVRRGQTSSELGRGLTSNKLPRPMMNTKDYDFSFSGLKTAVLYKARGSKLNENFVKEMCVEVQQAIIDVLIKKTLRAAKDFKAKTIILGGGVSANSELRSEFEIKNQNVEIKIIYPPKELSTDNGLMIAVAGYYNRAKKIAWQKLKADANLRVGK